MSNQTGSTSAAFQAICLAVDPDDAAAITQLTNSWQQDIDRLKVQWAAQVEADKRTQEAEDARLQDEADQAAVDAAKIAEEERLEVEKKKPKLGDFDVTKKARAKGILSTVALHSRGLKETAEARLSSDDDISALKLLRDDDNQLTVQSGPSSSTHKNMVRDEHLTWRQFSLGNIRYIKEIVRADWPRAHVRP
ncbi:hypothetical protein B0H10DRAFT_2215160 [Mycena sp. CBHHK59/15]|nr:hypothetical protein B0H10DRAFT_2215160 [Mycena sp. CBHHK59/15]